MLKKKLADLLLVDFNHIDCSILFFFQVHSARLTSVSVTHFLVSLMLLVQNHSQDHSIVSANMVSTVSWLGSFHCVCQDGEDNVTSTLTAESFTSCFIFFFLSM